MLTALASASPQMSRIRVRPLGVRIRSVGKRRRRPGRGIAVGFDESFFSYGNV
jgi:hypothetical protein